MSHDGDHPGSRYGPPARTPTPAGVTASAPPEATTDLAGLLAEGERAAFHGRPADAVAVLQRAVGLARDAQATNELTRAAWLLGVALGAAGRYGPASTVLRPLSAGRGQQGRARLLASPAASTWASHHRQVGLHAEAAAHDARALELAGDDDARFDALLGLAADAVGQGDRGAAAERLAEAEAVAEARRGERWRPSVRLDWVRAEVALLDERADDAADAAQDAVDVAEEAHAPRHVAKSLLFRGVAEQSGGDVDAAAETLEQAATLAESLGALPLVWPARAVLGVQLAGRGDAGAAEQLRLAAAAVDEIGRHLPAGWVDGWAAREDLVALRAAAAAA